MTGNLVNFFNPNDFALATGNLNGYLGGYAPFLWWFGVCWENNQINYKPDSTGTFGRLYYSFQPTASAGQRGKLSDSSAGLQHYVTDPHEMMSFVARPRSKAVGALAGVSGKISSEVDLNANFGFDRARGEHSAEFNWNIQRVSSFYLQLIQKLGFATIN